MSRAIVSSIVGRHLLGLGKSRCICFLLESVTIDMNKLWFEHAQMVEEIDFFLVFEVAHADAVQDTQGTDV